MLSLLPISPTHCRYRKDVMPYYINLPSWVDFVLGDPYSAQPLLISSASPAQMRLWRTLRFCRVLWHTHCPLCPLLVALLCRCVAGFESSARRVEDCSARQNQALSRKEEKFKILGKLRPWKYYNIQVLLINLIGTWILQIIIEMSPIYMSKKISFFTRSQ